MPEDFLEKAGDLAKQFGWPFRTFERDGEAVCVASCAGDEVFERFVWVFDTERVMLKCMMVARQTVPARRRSAAFELCARVNEALPFGCLEYSFESRVLVVRDSADLDWGPLDRLLEATTARTLNLGKRYAKAIVSVLQGEKPENAIEASEAE